MIPLLDDYFKEMLEKELDFIQTNPGYLDDVFKFGRKPVDKLKEYLGRSRKSPIKVVLAYPLDPQVVPCIVVQLGGEQDMPEGLGDYSDEEEPEETLETCTESITLERDESGRLFFKTSNVAVRELSESTVLFVDMSLSSPNIGKFYIVDRNNIYSEGESWVVQYRYAVEGYQDSDVVRTSCTYRLEIWDNNVDRAVMLYALLKSFLIKNRSSMTMDGLCNITISGADFEPLPEYFPTPLFRRAISTNFTIINSVKAKYDIVQSAKATGEVMESGEDDRWQ